MIVISGALVLVALVLLVLGVTQSDINLVYGCIVVSLVSLVFLVLGIVQRRGELLPGAVAPTEPTPGSATSAPTATGSAPGRTHDVDPDQDDDRDDAQLPGDTGGITAGGADRPGPAVTGTVLVVANRPRYHVGGCRYLAGKQAQEVDVLDAREAGFTPCGVCTPDARRDGTGGEPQAGPDGGGPFSDDSTWEASGRQGSSPLAAAPAGHADAPAEVRAVAVASSPATQPDTHVQPAAQRPPVESPPPAAGQVVVIPDRNRYHRADCRHVRGTAGTETLDTWQARQQGYAACGVCKP